MIIWTAKLHKGRLVAGGIAVAALICGVAVLLGVFGRAATASATVSPKGIKTPEDRIAYLQSYGWQVKEEPLAVEELLVPEEFGSEYADYAITTYPTGETGVQVSLLLYKNTVVGADVLSPALDGFIHGLTMPSAVTTGTLA